MLKTPSCRLKASSFFIESHVFCLIIGLIFINTMALAQPFAIQPYAVTTLQPAQQGEGASNMIDGSVNTIYHSRWGQVGIPDEVNFYFTSQVTIIQSIVYTPRQSGTNGMWTNVSLKYSTHAAPNTFIDVQSNINWPTTSQDKVIELSEPIVHPFIIRFEVHQGAGNFSSCAEMRFFSNESPAPNFNGIDCSIPASHLTLNGANDIKATIQVSGSTASSFQPGENINRAFDGDINTLYHSSYNNTVFPVLLNFRLDGITPIDYLRYIPRADGGTNGNFGHVQIHYNTLANSEFQPLLNFNFQQNGLPTTVHFPFQITPLNIRISVLDGSGNFASCAEMEFYTAGENNSTLPYQNIFTDALYAHLQTGIGQGEIDTIADPFYKGLAQCLFNGTYKERYRVQSYEVFTPLSTIRQTLKVGTYDHFENATGIVFEAGERAAMFVRNIPSGVSVMLAVKDFASDMWGPVSYYELRNGLNVFQVSNPGLGYITYFNDDLSLPNVEANIVTGRVNGFFDRETSTNAEWPELLLNSAYPYIDIRGKYAHLMYQKASLRNGCPFDGQLLIARYDTIVDWQRVQMGWYHYQRAVKNRILTYNTYGGGYYAGGLGVHLDLSWGEDDLTHPERLGIWGISHEYGHINQIRPDLMWHGTVEVTVNIYTGWAHYHMNGFQPPHMRLEEENVVPAPGIPAIRGGRINGHIFETLINDNHVQGHDSYDVFKVLVPFWQLQVYYSLAGACRNAPPLSFNYPENYNGIHYAHWYGTVAEMARSSQSEGLSAGELILQFVRNTCDAVQEDLSDFFIKAGFHKPVDVTIDDYGWGQIFITPQQVEQTINYIKGKGYPEPISPVIHYASAHSMHMFRDQLPLGGVTGQGVSLSGNYLIAQHSTWQNAVAYETYDAQNNLIYVSISGSGDPSNQSTRIYYPANALAVYAVGFDGQKILVYPDMPAFINPSNMTNTLKVFPNPVLGNNQLKIELENPEGIYFAQLNSIDGRKLFNMSGSVEDVEKYLNQSLAISKPGVYLFSLTTAKGQSQHIKLVKGD